MANECTPLDAVFHERCSWLEITMMSLSTDSKRGQATAARPPQMRLTMRQLRKFSYFVYGSTKES